MRFAEITDYGLRSRKSLADESSMNTNNAKNLARYHARSPRYILNTEDDCLIRVAGPHQIPWEEGTVIQNVSLTGLAFTAPEDLCPVLGEVIKIQFKVPGSKSMACHALVIRHEKFDKNDVGLNQILVGVHFYKLEMPHRINLAQGLAEKANASQKLQEKNQTEAPPSRLMLLLPFALAVNFFLLTWLGSMLFFTRFSTAQMIQLFTELF